MNFNLRVGLGYDSHPFHTRGQLLLGGVIIPDAPSLRGVSDADVLFHAIADALLGACGAGDIGEYFPPENPSSKGLKSSYILSFVRDTVKHQGYEIINLDIVIICSRVRLKSYLSEMKKNIAEILSIPPERVNIKVKSTEGMGLNDPEEGIVCIANVLLKGAGEK